MSQECSIQFTGRCTLPFAGFTVLSVASGGGGSPIPNPNPAGTIGDLWRQSISLMWGALAPSSRLAYERAWKKLEAFCNWYQLPCAPPISGEILACFCTYLFNKGSAASTIRTTLSAISYIHKAMGVADYTSCHRVNQVLIAVNKARPGGDQRKPITVGLLKSLVNLIPSLGLAEAKQVVLRTTFLWAFFFGLSFSGSG